MKRLSTGLLIIAAAFAVGWARHRIHLWESWVSSLEQQLLLMTSTTTDAATTTAARGVEEHDDDSTIQSEALPDVVQTYLERALPETFRSHGSDGGHPHLNIHSVKVHQEGHFRVSDRWVALEARQTTRAVRPPGFVWDATISTTDRFSNNRDLQQSWWPTIQVCDAWVDGGRQAYMRAALANVWNIVNAQSTMTDQDDHKPDEDNYLWVGQAMRWLGEAVLVPTALLPEHGLVEWSSVPDENENNGDIPKHDHRAILTLRDPRRGFHDDEQQQKHSQQQPSKHLAAVRLEVEFDPTTGFPSHVRGLRPYEREVLDEQQDFLVGFLFPRKRTSWEWRQWEGRFSGYQRLEPHGFVVPTYMEAGWVRDDDDDDGGSGVDKDDGAASLNLYFKAENAKLEYNIVELDKGNGSQGGSTTIA